MCSGGDCWACCRLRRQPWCACSTPRHRNSGACCRPAWTRKKKALFQRRNGYVVPPLGGRTVEMSPRCRLKPGQHTKEFPARHEAGSELTKKKESKSSVIRLVR